ncbi:MAG: hypothetical protein ACXWVG_03170 [Telluria sp.]
MRPSDENQNGSNRPNLMSSSRRPAASEDGILASLERGSGTGAAQAQRSWLIIGGTAAAILTAMLGWIAYNNATSVRTLPVSAVKRTAPAAEPVAMREEPRPDAVEPPLPLPQPATIIDEQATAAAQEPSRPALVMLPPEEVSGDKASPPRPETVPPIEVPVPVTAPVLAPAPKPVIARAAEPVRKVEKPARSVAARAATVKTVALRPTPRPATARKAKGNKAAKPIMVPELDSDVALISAIVAHSTRHAADRAQQDNCEGRKCKAKAASEP